MKSLRTIIAALLLLPFSGIAQTVLFTENFDSHALGDYITVVNPQWRTWSNSPGGADDVKISDEEAFSTPHALKFYAAAPDGAGDLVLKLDDKTVGEYDVEFKMFIGDSSVYGGYFNMLHTLPAAAEWAFSLVFDMNNDLVFSWNNVPTTIGTYTKGVWNDIKVKVNLDTDSAHLWINNIMLVSWQWSIQESGGAGAKQLAGVNFYTYAGGAAGSNVLYYIDDVKFTQTLGIGIAQPLPIEWVKGSPNPTMDIIRFDNIVDGKLELHNANGSYAGAFAIDAGRADIGNLPAGVYLARIITGENVHRTKIVKL
ncbi:MAG: T9SS type A sorting domain-containing protein [Bacteroidales bacterium]